MTKLQICKSAKRCSPLSFQQAVNDGFEKPVIAEGGSYELRLLVKSDQDLGQKFEAFDRDEDEMLTVNGWLFTISDDPQGR